MHHLDVIEPLQLLYGDAADVGDLMGSRVELVVDATLQRPDPLRRLDRQREIDPGWFQRSPMVGYVCYADRFAGTLVGVRRHLDYLGELGITYLHVMPVLEPRKGPNDGGYAVADYRSVDPRLGTMEDLEALAEDLHTRNMSLCIDLVLNHTAAEHPWAQAALRGDPTYRAFYRIFPDREMPDRFEQTMPEVFPDTSPGSFTHVDGLGWVWTTFESYQWDLDWGNPDVFAAMLDMMLFLANRGIDVLRLDAAPFLWKREGTNCQNQPEVHLLLQAMRALMTVAAPAVACKVEAIVAPDDLVTYLGVHHGFRPEGDIAQLSQRLLQRRASGVVRPRSGLPGQSAHRRSAHLRHGRCPTPRREQRRGSPVHRVPGDGDHPGLAARAAVRNHHQLIETGNRHVLAYARRHPRGTTFLGLANFSDSPGEGDDQIAWHFPARPDLRLASDGVRRTGPGIWLPAWGWAWLADH